ncbi:TipJ family phage tail tip protein [Morganella morganii]|uniref:TipJ family phage tail tip protein n=2 Tax=Morganella morganii TaxID=582 RepID=UPI00076B5BCC|nr:phage tail protein [Morganella morganii]AMG69515.1 DUF1983 domain-containing protein [Morganella morganii]EKU4289413.1 DUF1983 domain-containing protein [Morganella morganii]EKU4304948.1 DUF1983 domain-containing protein [Morganella morganii]EKU5661635.1 DUF1983 domain-containing protein [Morganella morganii]EKU5688985.1 DUF1983 domain-containing protein [Morganella morganii]
MGKGGGGQRTPYEAPNDLSSRQKISLIDLISEGPVEGPEDVNNEINDLSCVYLDDTPVVDKSGNSTVNGMTLQWRAGTLEQPALGGFTDTASEVFVGIEVKYEKPVTRTITSPYVDRLRLTFGTLALVKVEDNGDSLPSSVRLAVDVQRNGTWVTEKQVTIAGKRSNSPYLMAVILDNLPKAPFSVRMRRLTQDSTTDRLRNNTVWSGYSELTDVSQTYPGSAVAGLTFESEQFGNRIPRRNYLIRGRIIQVPSNYDPETREYTGLWDGTFKPAWTDNPAWILWDLLTHPRYGMGQRLKIQEVDKFALYMIGRYCDQPVDDGFGGREPRVRCNAYITDVRKAYDVISDLCVSMRIMPVWNGQMMTFVQDSPGDVVWPYTNANVVDGVFDYSFSPAKARHNVVEVRFVDPDNGWKTSIEQVSDDTDIALRGRNVLRVDAFGCTARGQAHRHGLWLLMTEKLEIQTVEFKVGAEGLRHTPGDIVEISDNDWAAAQTGGRIKDVDTEGKTLQLDREITAPDKGSVMITITGSNGLPQPVRVTGYPAADRVTLETLPAGVVLHSVWTLHSSVEQRRLFRAVSVADNGDGTFNVLAVQHAPEKQDIVDKGAVFDPGITARSAYHHIPPVENLSVEIFQDNDALQAEATWHSPFSQRGIEYHLKLMTGDRVAGTAVTTSSFYRFGGMPEGHYYLIVVPQNDKGQKGAAAETEFSVNAPNAPSHITVEPGYFSLGIIPRSGGRNSLRVRYEFWFSGVQIKNIGSVESSAEYLGTGSMWVVQGRRLKAGERYYIYVRSINHIGKSEFIECSGVPISNAEGVIEAVSESLSESPVIQQLSKNMTQFGSSLENTRYTMNANFRSNVSAIKQAERAQAESERNLKKKIEQVTVSVGNTQADIQKHSRSITSLSNSIAESEKRIQAKYNGHESAISRIERSYAESERAQARQLNLVTSSVGSIRSEIRQNNRSITTLSGTTAEYEKRIQAKLNTQEAVIQTKTTAMFEQNNNGYAMHSVNVGVKVNGVEHNAGMVIGADVKWRKVKTTIGFNADNFAFYNPATGSMDLFMYIQNGQVFMRESFINKAWLNSVVVSNKMESDNYVAGEKGFLLDAKKNVFEMNSNEGGSSLSFDGTGLRLRDENGNIRIEIGLRDEEDDE